MAKFDKYFALAKEKNIEALELYVNRQYSLSFSLFHGEIDSYSLEDDQSLSARGIYNGKIGYVTTEKTDKSAPSYIVDRIIKNAKAVDKDDPAIIFKGSEKYKKANLFNKKTSLISVDQKLAKLYEIEAKLKKADSRIAEVQSVSYAESVSDVNLLNSYGVNLKSKTNYFYYYAGVIVNDGEEKRSGYKIFLSNNPDEFDLDAFVNDVVSNAISKIGAKSVASKKYPTILAPRVASSLLNAYLSSASAEEVQRQSSLFVGKLHQPVASKKITVIEAPLTRNCFFRYFDDEGVATYNKSIIKKGVLETYFYNLLAANKDQVTTTGNGYRSGSGRIGINFVNVILKPGRKSRQDLVSSLKEGVIIEEVQGLHAGLNPKSGNFSLQASGFLVKDGKIERPLNLITVAGNLKDLWMDVKDVASDSELQLSSFNTPSVLIKKLSISGQN